MTDTTSALRATSDALLRDLDALSALEAEKRTLPPSDPRLDELAEHVHEIARRVLARTGTQRELAREAAAAPTRDLPIDAVLRSPADILAEWREVEQRRHLAEAGSAARAELDILGERLREEYLSAFEQTAHEGHRLA